MLTRVCSTFVPRAALSSAWHHDLPVCLPLWLAKTPLWPPITCPCGSIATVAVCRFKGVGKKTVACVLMFCLGSHEVCSLPLCICVARILALVAV